MSTGSSMGAVLGYKSLVCEILSRLPVDSLQSCKWVCRSWQSLIRMDPYFIELHFKRSTARFMYSLDNSGDSGDISLLIEKLYGGPLLSAELQLSYGKEEELHGRAIVRTEIKRPPVLNGYAVVVGVINGLICFLDPMYNCACIWNPSTGESSPWFYSAIAQQKLERQVETVQLIDANGNHKLATVMYDLNSCDSWYSFGYDPATKEHKVLCFWHKLRHIGPQLTISNIKCEVLTIGGGQHDPRWRNINEDSLLQGIGPSSLGKHLYACGSIYWLRMGMNPTDECFILEFNVGSEKFTRISVPSFIVDDIKRNHINYLVEADGRPAVIAPDIDPQTSLKMCILYDDHDRDKKMENTSSATCTSYTFNYYWTEETFVMPMDYWVPGRSYYIQGIPGTDLFIIRRTDDGVLGFCYYNWRKKIFYFSDKFEVAGIPDFKCPSGSSLYTWKPYFKSLLPVA